MPIYQSTLRNTSGPTFLEYGPSGNYSPTNNPLVYNRTSYYGAPASDAERSDILDKTTGKRGAAASGGASESLVDSLLRARNQGPSLGEGVLNESVDPKNGLPTYGIGFDPQKKAARDSLLDSLDSAIGDPTGKRFGHGNNLIPNNRLDSVKKARAVAAKDHGAAISAAYKEHDPGPERDAAIAKADADLQSHLDVIDSSFSDDGSGAVAAKSTAGSILDDFLNAPSPDGWRKDDIAKGMIDMNRANVNDRHELLPPSAVPNQNTLQASDISVGPPVARANPKKYADDVQFIMNTQKLSRVAAREKVASLYKKKNLLPPA